MKILYHHRVGSKDGQAVHIEEIVAALRALGHEVVVVGPATTERAAFGADAGFSATLKKHLPRAVYELLELAYSVPAFWRLWRAWRRLRPDVLYERYNLYFPAGSWLHWLTGVPMLLEVNAPLVHERSRFGGLGNPRFAAWMEGVQWRSADGVLPVTQVLAGFVREAGVPNARIHVIQNGVGEEFLSSTADGSVIRNRFGLGDRIVLGFTGFVREWHGLDRVIDFVAENGARHNLNLLIVGDGPAIPALRRQSAERRVADRVTFAGLVARHDIIDSITAFDVALQPHVVAYASPLKLIEYMALGRAIVAPATPNIREILSDSEAVLFEPSDPAGLPEAIARLSTDAPLRARLGAAVKDAVARQRLTWRGNAERIVALAETLRRK